MNGLDKITEKIISDARAKAELCESEASSKIKELKKEAVEEIMRMENVYMSRAERVSADIMARAESSSMLEYRNEILKKKTELISRAFDGAIKKILSLPKTQYVALVSDALVYAINERKATKEQLLSLYGEEEAELGVIYEVIFNKADIENGNAKKIFSAVSKSVSGVKLALSGKSADIDGGFILKCNDIETNCSLTVMVNEARARCESRVMKELF